MTDTERESGEHPVFDGSQDEPDPVTMRLHELFFDIDGKSLDHEQWRKAYPDGRSVVKSEGVLGLRVVTEFVGINHNPDPNGEPWIFETTVVTESGVVRSEWSTTLERAEYAHTWAVWVTMVRGPEFHLTDLGMRAILWWRRQRGRGRS